MRCRGPRRRSIRPTASGRKSINTAVAVEPDRPLVALLGATLTGLILHHERDAEVSLPLGADLLRVVGSDTVRLGTCPGSAGFRRRQSRWRSDICSVAVWLPARPSRSFSLTTAGLGALDDYRHRCAAGRRRGAAGGVERRPHTNTRIVGRAHAAAGRLAAQNPYLAQTRRLMADPVAALPWHPMVLHRAGWPDGS